ncbi:Protein CBG11110 [Caenorhabditis briggsae]|uniref:Protein CBG11110 n=1 Tax=Caenorhabditis briggsae TaxID=6238 RepID=A8XCF6_CAEBR|nr:Protein CBG11110 [Caenorhabditis briggsae]CAP30323.2 Protein CBG11110 [Caenorhabditis briggsae]
MDFSLFEKKKEDNSMIIKLYFIIIILFSVYSHPTDFNDATPSDTAPRKSEQLEEDIEKFGKDIQSESMTLQEAQENPELKINDELDLKKNLENLPTEKLTVSTETTVSTEKPRLDREELENEVAGGDPPITDDFDLKSNLENFQVPTTTERSEPEQNELVNEETGGDQEDTEPLSVHPNENYFSDFKGVLKNRKASESSETLGTPRRSHQNFRGSRIFDTQEEESKDLKFGVASVKEKPSVKSELSNDKSILDLHPESTLKPEQDAQDPKIEENELSSDATTENKASDGFLGPSKSEDIATSQPKPPENDSKLENSFSILEPDNQNSPETKTFEPRIDEQKDDIQGLPDLVKPEILDGEAREDMDFGEADKLREDDDDWISWDLIHFLLLLSPYEEDVITWWNIVLEAVKCSLRSCSSSMSVVHHRSVELPRITRHRRQDSEFDPHEIQRQHRNHALVKILKPTLKKCMNRYETPEVRIPVWYN